MVMVMVVVVLMYSSYSVSGRSGRGIGGRSVCGADKGQGREASETRHINKREVFRCNVRKLLPVTHSRTHSDTRRKSVVCSRKKRQMQQEMHRSSDEIVRRRWKN